MQSGVDSETKEDFDTETQIISSFYPLYCQCRAFPSNFGKRPLAKIGKKRSKLGEINGIEHKKVDIYECLDGWGGGVGIHISLKI